MTFDSDRAGRRHHRPSGFDRAHRHHDRHSRGSDPVPGEGAGADGEPDASQPSPPRPKRLSREAQRRLQAARLWIAANRPYYSKALFSCPVIPAAALAQIGIDEQWRIYANSEFLESLTVQEAAAELIHVLNHALRDHAQRARNSSVDAGTVLAWNAAADCEINDDLYEDDLIEDPDDWLFPEDLGMSEYMPAEHYYRHLLDNGRARRRSTSSADPDATATLSPTNSTTDTEALSDFDRTLLKRAVAAAVADHRKAHGTGSVPGGLARWAEQTLHPKVNWRQQLAAALRSSVHHKTGTADYTWQRPSRRQQPQDLVLRPAMTRPVPSITVVVDTSGSMSEHELDRALTEISAIIATVVPGDSVRVLSVDADVHTDQRIHNTRLIRLEGAGGTNMAAGIAAAAEANPDAIVVITDGWTPWPPTRPAGARCVIAALTDDCRMRDVPDWIQTVDMSGDLDLMRPTLSEMVEAGLTDERRQFLALLKRVHQHDWGLVARTALTAGSMARLLEDGLWDTPGAVRSPLGPLDAPPMGWSGARAAAEKELELAEEAGSRVVTVFDDQFPFNLRRASRTYPFLSYDGTLNARPRRSQRLCRVRPARPVSGGLEAGPDHRAGSGPQRRHRYGRRPLGDRPSCASRCVLDAGGRAVAALLCSLGPDPLRLQGTAAVVRGHHRLGGCCGVCELALGQAEPVHLPSRAAGSR